MCLLALDLHPTPQKEESHAQAHEKRLASRHRSRVVGNARHGPRRRCRRRCSHVWNANAGVAATEACIAPLANPLHESRIYAMMHVAIHDALNAIDRRSRPYAFDRAGGGGRFS